MTYHIRKRTSVQQAIENRVRDASGKTTSRAITETFDGPKEASASVLDETARLDIVEAEEREGAAADCSSGAKNGDVTPRQKSRWET